MARRKIGAGTWSAMGRQGWREIRAAIYPDSNVAQPAEYGVWGTQTPGETAEDRRPEEEQSPQNADDKKPDGKEGEAKKESGKWWQRLFGRGKDDDKGTSRKEAVEEKAAEGSTEKDSGISERLNRTKHQVKESDEDKGQDLDRDE